jgi:microcystin-dependent protein
MGEGLTLPRVYNYANIIASTIIDKIYPIGHILMTENSANPNTYFGVGTWTAYGAGKVPVGIDTSQTEFDTVGETGGEKTHTLTIAKMPAHTHTSIITNAPVAVNTTSTTGFATAYSSTSTLTTSSTGGDGAHNNLQPYIVCYMWKRTA